jgi:hypothetical protein
MDEDESLKDNLYDHTGQPLEWAHDLHRRSDETSIADVCSVHDVYLRTVECARIRADAHGMASTPPNPPPHPRVGLFLVPRSSSNHHTYATAGAWMRIMHQRHIHNSFHYLSIIPYNNH